MLRYLHALAAVLFYLIGGGFFLAYVFLSNDILRTPMAAYLYAGQLPLLLAGILYGGLSVYRSLHAGGQKSCSLALLIALPLAALFLFALILRLLPS